MDEIEKGTEEQRERVIGLSKLCLYRLGRMEKPVEEYKQPIVLKRREGVFSTDNKKEMSEIDKMIATLKRNNYLQKLYWYEHSYNYYKLLKEIGLTNKEEYLFYEKTFIDKISWPFSCLFCGKESSTTFYNYQQFETCESYAVHKEPYCVVERKSFACICPDCVKKSPGRIMDWIEELKGIEGDNERRKRIYWLKKLRKKDYSAYLRTMHWEIVRRAKDRFDGIPNCFYCEHCKDRFRDFDYHHNTYEYIGEEEDHLDCIERLCRTCHETIHAHEEIS